MVLYPARMRFRTTVERGGKTATGLQVPDEVTADEVVDVDIELDVAPREVTVPPDLEDALTRDDEARRFFDALAHTHRKEWVRWIEEAKKPETVAPGQQRDRVTPQRKADTLNLRTSGFARPHPSMKMHAPSGR